jgi:cyanophycinase
MNPAMALIPKPIFLLSDSLLLFAASGSREFASRILDALDVPPQRARAAYLGASNGDAPEYFDMFREAMKLLGIEDCLHIPEAPSPQAYDFLQTANLILLAGGDVEKGWHAFERANLVDRLRSRSRQGAVMVGVSAGAIQLGTCTRVGSNDTLGLLSLVPYAVGVREEPDWPSLASLVGQRQGEVIGLGIPSGAGVVVHVDLSIEPVRKPITEVSFRNGEVQLAEVTSCLPPSDEAEPAS